MHLVLSTSQDVLLHKRIADVPRRRAPRDRKVLMPALTRAHQLIQSARTIWALRAQSAEFIFNEFIEIDWKSWCENARAVHELTKMYNFF